MSQQNHPKSVQLMSQMIKVRRVPARRCKKEDPSFEEGLQSPGPIIPPHNRDSSASASRVSSSSSSFEEGGEEEEIEEQHSSVEEVSSPPLIAEKEMPIPRRLLIASNNNFEENNSNITAESKNVGAGIVTEDSLQGDANGRSIGDSQMEDANLDDPEDDRIAGSLPSNSVVEGLEYAQSVNVLGRDDSAWFIPLPQSSKPQEKSKPQKQRKRRGGRGRGTTNNQKIQKKKRLLNPSDGDDDDHDDDDDDDDEKPTRKPDTSMKLAAMVSVPKDRSTQREIYNRLQLFNSTLRPDNLYAGHKNQLDISYYTLYRWIGTRIGAGMIRSSLTLLQSMLFDGYEKASMLLQKVEDDEFDDFIHDLIETRKKIAAIWCIYAHTIIEVGQKALEEQQILAATNVSTSPIKKKKQHNKGCPLPAPTTTTITHVSSVVENNNGPPKKQRKLQQETKKKNIPKKKKKKKQQKLQGGDEKRLHPLAPPPTRRPLVFAEDRPMISDNLYLTFEQMRPAILMAEDRVGCYSTHEIGFRGFACKHCTGTPGCGRYFPPSEACMYHTTTVATIMNHLKFCGGCPIEIKQNLETIEGERVNGPNENPADRPNHDVRHKVFMHKLWCRIQGLRDDVAYDVSPPENRPKEACPPPTTTAPSRPKKRKNGSDLIPSQQQEEKPQDCPADKGSDKIYSRQEIQIYQSTTKVEKKEEMQEQLKEEIKFCSTRNPARTLSLISRISRVTIARFMEPIDNALIVLGWTIEKRHAKKNYFLPGEYFDSRTNRLMTVAGILEFLMTNDEWKDNETVKVVIGDFVTAIEKEAQAVGGNSTTKPKSKPKRKLSSAPGGGSRKPKASPFSLSKPQGVTRPSSRQKKIDKSNVTLHDIVNHGMSILLAARSCPLVRDSVCVSLSLGRLLVSATALTARNNDTTTGGIVQQTISSANVLPAISSAILSCWDSIDVCQSKHDATTKRFRMESNPWKSIEFIAEHAFHGRPVQKEARVSAEELKSTMGSVLELPSRLGERLGLKNTTLFCDRNTIRALSEELNRLSRLKQHIKNDMGSLISGSGGRRRRLDGSDNTTLLDSLKLFAPFDKHSGKKPSTDEDAGNISHVSGIEYVAKEYMNEKCPEAKSILWNW